MSLTEFKRIDIRLDKANDYIPQRIYAKQGDANGRDLYVQLTNNGEIVDTTGTTINLGWTHLSTGGTGLDSFTDEDLSQGIYKHSFTTAFLQPGRVECSIQIVTGTDILNSRTFIVEVDGSTYDETAVESDNSFTALQDALLTVESIEDRLDNAIEGLTVDSEVIDARHSTIHDLTYPVLGARIDDIEVAIKTGTGQVPADYTDAPGPKFLAGGDRDAGWFGFVRPEEFISGDALATELGITAGTSQNSDTPWIKYIIDGKICFKTLKTVRYSIPWDAIYNAGAVYGDGSIGTLPPAGRLGTELTIDASDNSINTTAHFLGGKSSANDYYDDVGAVGDTIVLSGWTNSANNGSFTIDSITDTKIIVSGGTLVTETGSRTSKMYNDANKVTQNAQVVINGLTYRVRLMKGGANDPLDSYSSGDRGSLGDANEWNKIILPLHERAKTQNWNYPAYAGSTEYWGADLTDRDMRTHNQFGNGSYHWCQETRDDAETYRRVIRGYVGASGLAADVSWFAFSGFGWAPVLELIG